MIQILSILATPSIAIAVAIIAWRQWETAKQKLMLDLFEKRMQIYSMVERARQLILQETGPVDRETIALLQEAQDKAKFLFGPEIAAMIGQIIVAAIDSNHANQQYKAGLHDKGDWPGKMREAGLFIMEARMHFSMLLLPYMKMDQRLPNTEPGEPLKWKKSD